MSFSFGFFAPAGDGAAPATAVSELPAATAPSAGRYAIVLIGQDVSGFGVGNAASALRRGDTVGIDWAASTYRSLRVTRLGDGAQCELPPSSLCLLQSAADKRTCAVSGTVASDMAWHHDAVFNPPTSITAHPSIALFPMVLEPGLDSFCWPLTPTQFMKQVYRQRVWVCHAPPSRLAVLRTDFESFDPARLIASASRLVVWMKDKSSGAMQYLESGPEVAAACYAAGHSLYFNPPLEVQRKWVGELSSDLGLDFGAEMGAGGGGGEEGTNFGGDIEVFAVRGKHVTPWHSDAQDNFTFQLTGTKRWSIKPSGIPSPMANCHPSSSNAASRSEDVKVHRAYTAASLTPPVEGAWGEEAGVTTFVLRPGSVMYLPAGCWHRVESEEEGGSLSVNLSMGGARWADVLLRRLAPLLWRDERWRSRVHVQGGDPEAARADLGRMLSSLPSLLAALRPQHLLPDGLFASGKAAQVDVVCDSDEEGGEQLHTVSGGAGAVGGKKRKRGEWEGGGGASSHKSSTGVSTTAADEAAAAIEARAARLAARAAREAGEEQGLSIPLTLTSRFSRNILSSLVVEGEGEPPHTAYNDSSATPTLTAPPSFSLAIHSGFGSTAGEGTYKSDFSVNVTVPIMLKPAAQHLACLNPADSVSVTDLQSMCMSCADAVPSKGIMQLVRILCHNGYLLPA